MDTKHGTKRFSASRIIIHNAGETLVETLISILVCAIAILMMSTAIGSSVNIVQSTRDHMEDYYKKESEMIAASGTPEEVESNVALKLEENIPKNRISIALYAMSGTEEIAFYEVN